MPNTASGKKVVKLLVKNFGFSFVSQRGSHAKLKKWTPQGDAVTIVPMHHELAHGTLRGVLKLAKVDWEEFQKFL